MFEQHPSLTYRVSQLEIAQAAERAERARVIAENADRLPPRAGMRARLRNAVSGWRAWWGRAASSAAERSTAAAPMSSPTAATSCAASPRLATGRPAASRPAPVASRAAASRSV